ncbi:MAG: helicase, partial [Peptidiphaga gingivicola]
MGELSARSRAIADEQGFVETAYAALDRQREAYSERLREVRAQQGHESAGALSERDSFATHYEDNLIRLRNVENRLVMGRLDFTDGETEHIGRIGLKDEDQEIILLDWRTPQAEPFYRATAAEPGDVVRRRHIQTRMRDVVGVEDELLDAEASDGLSDLNLTGEGALMAAMATARDGKM